MNKVQILFLLNCIAMSFSMERPPKAARPSSPQERESYPISPSPSEASASYSILSKRKQREPARAFKKPRSKESFSITFYVQNKPDLIKSKIQGNTLDLSGLHISSLDGLLAIPGIQNIFNISLAHNSISQIERKDFAGLSQLISLDISSNDIEILVTDGFAELANLHRLYLNNNRIFRIEHDAFAGLDSLKVLSLSHNHLAALHQKTFAGAHNLEELLLQDNVIVDIEKNTLANTPLLKKLKLNKNQLTKLTGTMFEKIHMREQIRGQDILKLLTELDLRNNRLTEIPTTILPYLPALQRLLLADNQISQVSRQNITALQKATQLKMIDLVNNNLTDAEIKKLKAALPQVEIIAIPAMETTETVENLMGKFAAAKSLSNIDEKALTEQEKAEESALVSLAWMHGSLRELLNDENFRFYPHVRGPYEARWYELNNLDLISLDGLLEIPYIHDVSRIYLNRNRLKVIPAHAFAGLTQLKEIDLSSNQIETFDPRAFEGIPKLSSVYLNNNQIAILTPEMIAQFKNVKGLILEQNKIKQLPPFIFKDLTQLKSLYIGHNPLIQLTPETFVGLENLESLMLQKSQLTYLNPAVFKPLKKLKLLNLAGNPLLKENREEIEKALPGVKVLF